MLQESILRILFNQTLSPPVMEKLVRISITDNKLALVETIFVDWYQWHIAIEKCVVCVCSQKQACDWSSC